MATTEESLRTEILGFQKTQGELHRWKLIVVGATASVAFAGTPIESSRLLLLSIVPFLTIYCDLMIRDYDIRIGLIAAYLAREKTKYSEYEQFLREPQVLRTWPWAFGNWATVTSSLIVCAFVVWVGIQPGLITGTPGSGTLKPLWIAGLIGMLGALGIHWQLLRAYDRIVHVIHQKEGRGTGRS